MDVHDPSLVAPADLLPGVLVGHAVHPAKPTGVTVVLMPEGSTGGVDVRGAAPGTHETDLLDPVNTVDSVDAIVLSGGSAFGLASVVGVVRWLEENGRGVAVGPVRVPIVPAAVIFDLLVGDPSVRPDADTGHRACVAAVPLGLADQGSVGAGAGATVGKLLDPFRSMRGGVGVATVAAGGLTAAAVVVVNAVGDVVDPATGARVAGARGADGTSLVSTVDALLAGDPPGSASPGGATTIGAIVTDARLTKAQARRLAQVGHDGLARTIRPCHTPMDGDTLFAVGTGTAARDADMVLLSVLAAEATAQAVLSGVRAATGLDLGVLQIPAARDLA